MKQFWTPLARIFGMADNSQKPLSAFNSNTQINSTHTNTTQWPDLFVALRNEAENNWCVRNVRHTEVNYEEILAITTIKIQALNQSMQDQLSSWFSETDIPHLIQWMVQGPFNTDLIKKNISFSQLAELDILKMVDQNEVSKESAYISTGETSTGSRFNIFIEKKWIQRTSIESDLGVLIPLELWIEDAHEKRVIKLHDPLIIFGSAKTLHFPDGQTKSVNHMDKFEWQGEYARYVHVNSQHVSGLHLILRTMDQSFQVQDLGSTNGTFLNGQKLNPTEGLLSSQTMILGLGGPLTDATHLSAHLHICASSFSSVVSNEKTPLRQASASETLPKLEIQISGNGIEHRLPIEKFPFTIGRDLNSDFIVPPEHVMVSRTHLVVESFNSTSQQVRVKDISRHGLTVSSEAFAESPTKEIWLDLGQSVSLGRTGSYEGIKIAFIKSHS